MSRHQVSAMTLNQPAPHDGLESFFQEQQRRIERRLTTAVNRVVKAKRESQQAVLEHCETRKALGVMLGYGGASNGRGRED